MMSSGSSSMTARSDRRMPLPRVAAAATDVGLDRRAHRAPTRRDAAGETATRRRPTSRLELGLDEQQSRLGDLELLGQLARREAPRQRHEHEPAFAQAKNSTTWSALLPVIVAIRSPTPYPAAQKRRRERARRARRARGS